MTFTEFLSSSYLLILKAIAAAIALYLGVSAIYIDFKEEKNRGKKKFYIIVFCVSIFLGLVVDVLKDRRDTSDTETRFNNVISQTTKLLNNTGTHLKGQFDNLNKVDDNIDKKLTGVSKAEKNLTDLTTNVKGISSDIKGNLDGAVNSIRVLNNVQEMALKNIKRNLYPLKDIHLNYHVYWYPKNQQLTSYAERLQLNLKAASANANFTDVTFRDHTSKFETFDGGKVSASFYSTNMQLEDVTIRDASSLMPSCNNNDEVAICKTILFDPLYVNFKSGTKGIYYYSHAFGEWNTCGKNSVPPQTVIAPGTSSVEIHMHFGPDGTLVQFDCFYDTTRLELLQGSKGMISQLDLLGSNLKIQKFQLGSFRIIEFRELSVYYNGVLEGLRIPELSNKNFDGVMDIDYTVKDDDFIYDVIN